MKKIRFFASLLLFFFGLSSLSLTAEECLLKKYEKIGGDFQLTGHDGKAYTLESFKDKIVWIYFGYTFCPDVCPMTLSNFKTLYKKLGEKAENVQVLFITVDPERDTPELLENYMSFFHPTFLGLYGDAKQTRALAAKFAVQYYATKSEKYTLISHTNRVFLLDKNRVVRSLGSASDSYEQLAAETRMLLDDCP